MSKQPRTHFALKNSDCGLTVALCGHLTPKATQDRDAITCRLCLRELDASPIPPEVLAPEPWVAPPERVVQHGQRRLTDNALKAIEESKSGKRQRFEFTSIGKAFEDYCAVCVDGHPSGSASASCETLGLMGVIVQTSGRSDSITTRSAERVAQAALILDHVFEPWERTHPYAELDKAQAIGAWLLMTVGLPDLDRSKRHAGLREYRPKGGLRAWVPVKASALVEGTKVAMSELVSLRKWANKRVSVEMIARGLLAEPLRPAWDEERGDQRMTMWIRKMDAVAARRAELGGL